MVSTFSVLFADTAKHQFATKRIYW